MRIIYVAKHDSGDNDDEGAIAFALENLGHEVVRIPEIYGRQVRRTEGDLLLFHKWADVKGLVYARKTIKRKVFWYFDLVDYDDPSTATRHELRKQWMKEILPRVDLGFCTDGDWVARNDPENLVWLPQGADERYVGYGKKPNLVKPLVITAGRQGSRRANHIKELEDRYGDRIRVYDKRRVHGRELSNVLASHLISVAPEAPATDNYWSNRVYLTLGLGGFLLHPFCSKLREHYTEDELVMYSSREELHELIERYVKDNETREAIRRRGHERTLREHLYRHRCERLIQVCQERLGL